LAAPLALACAGFRDAIGAASGVREDEGLALGVEGRIGVADGDMTGVGANAGGVLAAHSRPCCTTFRVNAWLGSRIKR
jgi:hypothetical protein